MQQIVTGGAHPAAGGIAGWRMTLSAACASLVGLGLARFSYTPLLPAVIGAHWFTAPVAASFGAANLAGYLAGAWFGRRLTVLAPPPVLLRGLMLVAACSMFACATPVSLAWFLVWRLLSGLSGGALTVLAAPAVLAHIAPNRRGMASGFMFAAVGIGITASGTLVPLLLGHGLRTAWTGLGVLSLVLTLVAWSGWPASDPAPDGRAVPVRAGHPRPVLRLRALYVEYALNGAGFVPHMLFLVDFVALGLGRGLESGARYWVLFGLGAMVGPVLGGIMADRIGFGPALRIAFVLGTVAVLLPACTGRTASLVVSSLVVGAFTPGIVPLVLGRVRELLPDDPAAQTAAWSTATTAFALPQPLVAYGAAVLLSATGGDFRLLFIAGAGCIVAAFAIDLAAGFVARGHTVRRRAGEGLS